MATLDRQTKGAIAEHYVVMRLLAMGYAAANINMTVGNSKYFDIMCSNPINCKTINIQVKSSYNISRSFNIGLTHDDFMVDNKFNHDKAMESLKRKIRCPWIFVNVDIIDDKPVFQVYVMTKEDVINLTYESERWYIEDIQRTKMLSGNGTVALKLDWIDVDDKRRNKLPSFVNTIKSGVYKEAWHKLELD